MNSLVRDITAATVESMADILYARDNKPTYSPDHKAAMRVPKGGSSCSSCEYVSQDKKQCSNEHFIKWNGSKDLPLPADEYCSDWYKPASGEIEAGGPGSGRKKDDGDLDTKRGIWSLRRMLDSLYQKRWPADAIDDQVRLKGLNDAIDIVRNQLLRMEVELEKKGIKAATEDSLAGDKAGTLWNGIKLTGFTGPEEEGVRAMLSRVPPELLFNVQEIKSAKELNAKHGRFIPKSKTVLFNPANFQLRQRFGKGDGWLYHPELTVVHEIGHSIYESWTPVEKQVWLDLSGWQYGWKDGQSIPYVETRHGWTPGTSPWTHKEKIKTPRHYSEKNPNEHFADCFAYYILGRAYQMSPECKAFLDQYFQDNVKNYTSVSVQSPSKAYITDPVPAAVIKEPENPYNITAGGPGSGRHPYGRHEKSLSDKAQRAKDSYVPQTKSKSRIARFNEGVVAQMVSGQTTGDNKPFDVVGNKFGIEVKTLFPGVINEKITMHPESLARKVKAARDLKVKPYTVAIDMRNKNSVGVYVKKGLGSFRLGSMTDIGSFRKLKDYIQ